MASDYITEFILKDEPKVNNGITGEVKTYWDIFKTNLYQVKNYKNGVLHGSYKSWYDNGNKFMEMNYVDGKIEGPFKEWDESTGTVVCEAVFKDGVFNGTCKHVYADGSYHICMYENDILDGEHREYDKNNILIEHKFYENGKINGPYRKLTKSGNYMTLYYKDDVRIKSAKK